MSMADNRRNRPEYSDDAYSPRQSEPSDPLAELARLIGQGDPFTDSQRGGHKPLDNFRAGERPAPEWLSRPSAAPRYAEPQQYQDRYDDGAHDGQDHAH